MDFDHGDQAAVRRPARRRTGADIWRGGCRPRLYTPSPMPSVTSVATITACPHPRRSPWSGPPHPARGPPRPGVWAWRSPRGPISACR
ncbi:hypothetical protein D4104_33075 [Streptomyces alfalfae]|nr:hypothetical protein D3X13_06645 [Streptomyces fradiae]RZM83705.1 hypothetical protein D4104_33075 [Streptomyces alfalfae]